VTEVFMLRTLLVASVWKFSICEFRWSFVLPRTKIFLLSTTTFRKYL